MGMVVNGAGSSAASSSFSGTVSIKSKNNAVMRMNMRKNNNRPKKNLNYNPREISSQIARAAKSRSASIVLIRAKSKLGVLLRQEASGQYDAAEIRTALAHARKMVECSRIKVRNLKEEETLKVRNDRDHGTKEIKKKAKIRRKVQQKQKALQAEIAIEEGKQVLDEKLKQQQLRQKRRMHRGDEQRRISKAELEYIQDQMKNNQDGGTISYNGVTLDLSSTAMSLSELKMMEQQLAQQAEIEVELELAAMDAGSVSSAALPDAGASMPSADGGAQAAPVSVDVMV